MISVKKNRTAPPATPTPGQPEKNNVREMFDRIAPVYDRLNRLLSLGIDRRWRRRTVRTVGAALAERRTDGRERRMLDAATGTADLAILAARRIPGVRIDGIDLSEKMVQLACKKVAKEERKGKIPSGTITLQTGDALAMPFAEGTFDAVTVAFGVRNFPDIPAGLREMYRVLAPESCLFVLEFSTPRNKIFGLPYRFYFHRVLPFIGRRISLDGGAYRYLPESVEKFPAPEIFCTMLREVGFRDARILPFTFGVACLYVATK